MNIPDPNIYVTRSFVLTLNILRSLIHLFSLIWFGGIYVFCSDRVHYYWCEGVEVGYYFLTLWLHVPYKKCDE
jgi:hypothetical protein